MDKIIELIKIAQKNGYEVCGIDIYKKPKEPKHHMLSADRLKGYIHIDEIYQRIAGHSNYHGDAILAAFTRLTEGKEVGQVKPLDSAEKTGEWIEDGCVEKCKDCGEQKRFPHWNFCPNCGADMRE